MKKLLHSSLAVVAALGLAVSAHAEAVVGKKAPNFTLKDSTGKSHSLSDFAGKTVVLEWINHGCPFVKAHYKSGNMQALQERAAADGVVWLSVCSSAKGEQGYGTAEQWQGMIKEHKMKSAAVLLDEMGGVGKMYGAKTTPHMYVIDGAGVLRYNGAIDSIPSAKPGDAAKATNYVAAALDAIKAGKEVAQPTTKPYGCGIKYLKDS
jgi:hypothetical protein